MNAVLAAVAALGILLIYLGITTAPRAGRNGSPLERLIAESGAGRLTTTRLIVYSIAAFIGVLVLVAGVTRTFVPSLAVAIFAAFAPIVRVRSMRGRRRRILRDAWPDALATMVAGLRAGNSLAEVCSSLERTAPDPLRAGFKAFAARYRAAGSFETAVEVMRATFADPVADRVAAVLVLAHQVGGPDLVRVLRSLGDFVREDLRVRKEIEARWSWTVTAARVAAASPWIVLLMMSTRPEAAAAYDSSAGMIVITCGAMATILGYRLMLAVARLPEERRHVR